MSHSSYHKAPLICPQCGGETKRIQIELEGFDWGKVLMGGWLAMMFPGKDRALVCEHCGKVFARRSEESALSQKVTRIMLLLIVMIVLLGVVLLFVGAWLK
jgi:predicted RNA-binding Zn-ribbon protein involved in translation (DUF1610 family)